MQEEDLVFFKKWFLNYVENFSSSDPLVKANIELKIEHTKRVCKNILLLAKSEKLGKEECRLAEAIALFHDLGRFEQFTKYRTFKDSESENHAALGVKILKKTRVLSRISESEENLILKAIEYHNLMKIPECVNNSSNSGENDSSELLYYSKLIRDADKLDILKLISKDCEAKEDINPALELYLPDTSGCSEPIIKAILNNKMAKIEDVKNRNDIKLLRLSWVFDINFPGTFALLRDFRYLEIIWASLPDTKDVLSVRKYLKAYLEKQVMSQTGSERL